jgi:hypothetical protein
MTTVAERLAARAQELVAIPSESRHEEAILAEIRRDLPSVLEVVDDQDSVLLALPERRPGAPLVLLAGHVDTVPIDGSAPSRRERETLHGRGASDMKSGLAVMEELAEAVGSGEWNGDLDVGMLFFGREELPFAESALVPLFDRRPEIADAALAIVLEPTANRLEVGCLGNLNATVVFEGEAAHAARPWLGRNAIHAAITALASVTDLPIRDVRVDGLTLPGGRFGHHDPGRCRHERGAGSGDRARQLPIRADAYAGRGGAPDPRAARTPERDGRDRGQRPARPAALREPAGGAASGRRRSHRRPEAGLDAGGRVRPHRRRRRQLRSR